MVTPEGNVQTRIRKLLREFGYFALKMEITAIAGYPDLLVIGKGRVMFIEVKRGGGKPRGLQKLRQRQLRNAGVVCEWFDNVSDLNDWLIKEGY